MQDHEPIHEGFGEDLEADSFEFEMGDEFETASRAESPQDEVEEPGNISQALPAGAQPFLQAAAARAASHRQQSGRWIRRGNTVVLFGI